LRGSRWHSHCESHSAGCGLPISDYEFRFVNPPLAIRNPQCAIRNCEGGFTVAETMFDEIVPDPAMSDRQVQVQVLATSMTIHELSIERASIVDYLKAIAPDKQAIALIHALEVGITEMLARRERFKS
jgi:hypothetical protein